MTRAKRKADRKVGLEFKQIYSKKYKFKGGGTYDGNTVSSVAQKRVNCDSEGQGGGKQVRERQAGR